MGGKSSQNRRPVFYIWAFMWDVILFGCSLQNKKDEILRESFFLNGESTKGLSPDVFYKPKRRKNIKKNIIFICSGYRFYIGSIKK